MGRIEINEKGFTLIELVIVLIMLSILSVFVSPKFFNLADYQARSAYDEIATALRYAQKLEVGSGCDVQVFFSGSSYALQ